MRASFIICLIEITYQISIKSNNPITELSADDLEYRALTAKEVGCIIPKGLHFFGGVMNGSGNSTIVKAKVHSRLGGEVPKIVLDNLPKKTKNDDVVYISWVWVVGELWNRRIASKMLPLALEDIRRKWPNVVAAYLTVSESAEYATRLYKNNNFTIIPEPGNDPIKLYIYKFPLCSKNKRESPLSRLFKGKSLRGDKE
ncbi:hypothetical protein FOL47_005876 [Perkinsus chesapeaki]|uniref:Uncharacterized protein n=1 Tax=Perkinsus chesapeaki TaxID=330153 RepID=A0A7J6LW31_PERCH|nr:hypothetical protein FOL47_005876 [Perkinsus chesapeaki]